MAFAALLLSLATLSPQEPQAADPRLSSVLSKAEQQKLNNLAREWFKAEREYEDEEDAQKRAKASKDRQKEKEKFYKEWRSKEKKEPLKHMGDLLAVFDNVFEYRKASVTSEIKSLAPKGEQPFSILAPKGYKETERYPTVLLLPSRTGDKWEADKDHLAATWKASEDAANWLFVIPKLEDGLELDPVPDLTTDAGQDVEKQRNLAVFGAAGAAQRSFHVDRSRLILDCGKGASGYGLRMATYFPSRFAGLILRHPVDPGELRLDGLVGMRVLVLSSDETKAAADKIATTLNELENGTCSVLEGGDAELVAKVAAWAKERRRDPFRKKVIVAPNHDQFRKNAWVSIDRAELLATASKETQPYLLVEADRDANRIAVTARGVTSFTLLLNDALLDLDKEFTVVINGKAAASEKRGRSFNEMAERVLDAFDPTHIWTTTYNATVPRVDSPVKAEGASGEPAK